MILYAMELVVRFVLSTVFLTSTVTKINSPSTLVESVQQLSLGLFRPKLSQAVARILPLVEFILAFALILDVWPKLIALLVLGLLILFTLSMGINLSRGNRFPCHCFGHKGSDIGAGALSRNSILIAMSLLLVLVSPWTVPELWLHSMSVTQLSVLNTIPLLTAGISLNLLLLALGDVGTLLRTLKLDKSAGSDTGNM